MDPNELVKSASVAAGFLRCLSNEKRLMIVCQLIGGEMNVGELCDALDARQSTVSQQLALLRSEGVVKSRKDAQTVYYSLADEGARDIVALLHRRFCSNAQPDDESAGAREKALA